MISREAPAGAEIVDLEFFRAARREARTSPNPVAHVAAGYIELQPEVDVIAADLLSEGKFREALGRIVAHPEDVDALIEGGFTAADTTELLKFLTGLSLGE